MVYVFHCCALADLPRWVKQSLQQRLEDWRQRSKTLVDQIHAVDPYYVPTNEYRFMGQVSYADIAAGRTNSPSSRNCSPYRHQREATPPTVVAQALRPAVTRAQKLTVEYPSSSDEAQITKTQENGANLHKSKPQRAQTTDDRGTIDAGKRQQDIPGVVVESSVPRRGRSLTRKTSSSKVKDPKAKVNREEKVDKRDDSCPDANSKRETQAKAAKSTLAPCEERRGRSPSPMWVPGSTSYADILRGCIQATQVNAASAQPSTQTMVSLSGESRRSRTEIPPAQQVTVDTVNKSQQVTEVRQVVPTQEIEVENARVAESYCQPVEISTEKAEDPNYAESESTSWADEALQDYNVLQHAPRQPQPTEIYDYIIPETMPELVGFIGSHLGTYPVSSYVYAPSGHQQVQQIDPMNLSPYNNGSLAYVPEHYVAQTTAYLSASDIYQQTPMQQSVNDMRQTTVMLMEKPVEVPVVKEPEVSKDPVATELIDKSEQQKSASISNAETSTAKKMEGSNTSSNNVESKGQTFSYAQILSYGLSPRVPSTRTASDSSAASYHGKERSSSPKDLSPRELSPLQESKLEQDPQSSAVTSEQSKQSKKSTDWDTMKKREVKKRQQQPSDKTKQMDERKSRKFIDKPKEKRKKEKLSPPKQLEMQDEFIPQIDDSPAQKEKEPMQQEKPAVDLIDINPSQEKKHRQKKRKVDKSVGDEIDKALREIEDMDKQKTRSQKDKPKDQTKEQSKPQDTVSEIEKYKDEEGKKQNKGEKAKRLGKSKEIRIEETVSVEHATLPSQIKASDQSILKDNAKDEENIKDAKVSDSKNEDEEIQKDISKENQLQTGSNIYVESDKPDAIKCKNKINKNTKTKERSRETSENKVQDQSDDLSNKKKDKMNVDENDVTEVAKLSPTRKIELEDTNEKINTKTEGTKKQNVTKKEKNKKSKESKLEAENSNREKLEDNIKGIIEDKSLESTKPLIEIKDSDSKADDVTKITDDVNENTKSKTRKRDKVASKSKIKSEVAIDTSSTIPTSKVLSEIKINLNGTKIYDSLVPKSEQVTDETKITEAAVVEEIQKEIVLLPETVQQIAQEIVQTDNMYKNDKTYDSAGVEELSKNKEVEHETNAKLEAESFTRENLETDTINEKGPINNNTKMIEKTEKREIEKGKTKTTKQKKPEKAKSNVQDKSKRKEDNIEILQPVENKSVGKKAETDIESLIATETIIQKQSTENLAEQHVSVPNNTCLVQSKTDAENNCGAKIDEGEDIALGQVNKRAREIVSKSKKKSKSKDKAVIQFTASIHDEKSMESSKLKDIAETTASASAELVTPISRELSRDETAKLTKDDAKSGIASTLAEEPTIASKMDLAISMAPENVEIIPTTETLPKESEVLEINNTVDMKEKYQNVKNGKPDQREAINKSEDITTDINNKDSLIKEHDIKKAIDVLFKEKTSKRTKKKGPKHAVEQTKQSSSFYDKSQEVTIFKDDSTTKEESPKLTTSPNEEKFNNDLSLAKIDDNIDIEKTQESSKKDELDSKIPSDSIKAQVKHIDDMNKNLESEQPPLTGKALIIEKMITTVTTTTSVPGSVKVKPPDVKSVKSVEIIENIPLPKIVGSKVTELITLRPETVEASLTTTYARVTNDSPVDSHSVQSDQAAISQKIGLTSANFTENIVIDDELAIFGSVRDRRKSSQNRDMSKKSPPRIIASEERKGKLTAQLDDSMEGLGHQLTVEVPEEKHENNNIKEENPILTTSEINVDTFSQNDNIIEGQDNNFVKSDNIISDKTSQADLNLLIEERDKCIDASEVNVDTIATDVKEIVDEKVEFEIKCESDSTSSNTKNKEISEGETEKQIVPEYLLELVKPYAMDRHVYNQAESNFYRYFKVVKIEKEPQPPVVVVQTRPKSVERIVQESVMKPIKSSSEEMHEEIHEINCRRHAVITEAPKYPITSFHEFESQWVKMKSRPEKSVSVSSEDSETSIKTAIEKEKQVVEEKKTINVVSDFTEDITAINVEKLKTIEVNNEDKDKKSRDLQQSVHLVSDDSWMDILDEPMTIEDDFDDTFNPEKNSINEAENKELTYVENQDRRNVSVEPSSGKISDNQLTDTGDINLNVQADETVTKNNIKIEQEMLEIKTTKIPSVHLESDDAWMALLEEEIVIDDDFDEPETETVKNNQIEKREEEVEKKETIKQQKEIEKSVIEKQDKIEKEPIIEGQIRKEEPIKKEMTIVKSEEEIKKKKEIEKCEEEIEPEKPKAEVLNNSSLTEIAVKDEYHTSIKDIQNETSSTDEKQGDRTKSQMKKKKESKHVKVTKTKDQAKTKIAKKQSDVEIKTDAIEGDLSSLQSNLEEHKILEKETDRVKEVDKSFSAEAQLHRDKIKSELLSDESVSKPKSQDTIDDEKPKREERKMKSDKKSKKQNQKSEIIKEKSAMAKQESNVTKENDNIVLSTEIEPNEASIVQKQQESKDNVPKYDNRLNPNAKSWAAIVGTRGVTEITVIPKDDSLNTQTSSIIHQDTNDSVTNITKQPQTLIVHDSCEIPSKEETFTMHSSSLDNQIDKNVIEELKAAMMDETVKPIAEKSSVPLKQLKEGNKSYAQVTASSRRISPQISQEETVKSIPLKTDHLTTNVKTSNEAHEDFNTEKLQSSEELIQTSSDHQTVAANLISQEESIPWVEEVEKETVAVSTISVNSTNMTDNETKLENTWAAIVGKKSVESEVKDIPNLEQNLPKSEQIAEQSSPTQVQIYVEEAPKQEPIENLVQVDEQGFMEFVNRKQLRSRRSRSRSRSAKRDNKCGIVETSNSLRDKEIKTPDIKSENSENVKAEEEVENKIKQSVQKYEDEQKTVDESNELAKIIKGENAKPSDKVHASKSKDKNKQKNDSSKRDTENKMQFAENKIHDIESKTVQEIKPELNIPLKDKKNKSKKNKSSYMKQQEINEQKESKQIEKPKEDKESANENEMEYNKIQLENIEDQSIKEAHLIKDTKNEQENKCKDVEVLPIIDQDNSTKSKKKKNKKGKLIEQLIENTSDIDKKTVIAGDLEEKIKSVELKLDDEIKLEEAVHIRNISTCPENVEAPTEIITKHIMETTVVEATEQEGIEQKMIVDESKNTKACKEAHVEQIEKNIMEEEISQLTKTEKRKQKKKAKIAQSKSTDLSDDTDIIEDIKTKETVQKTEETVNTAPLKDKLDDAFVLKKNDESIQSVQIMEIEKPLEKFEAVIENKASPSVPIQDKQKAKSKSKSKKEKRQQDDKIKSQNLTADSEENEVLSTVGNTEIINLSEDKQKDPIKCSKEDAINITDETASIANETIPVISKEIESSVDFTEEEKNNIVLVEFAKKLEISDNEKEKETEDKCEINEKQVETNDAEKVTVNSKKIKLNEHIIDQEENVLEKAFVDNVTLTEKSELLQTEEPHPEPDPLKLYEVTVNNDITKIESVILDKAKNSADEIGTDTSAPINPASRQTESPCDSTNAAIKHSPPSDKLSSVVQQSFEDEDKLKRIASIEQENSDPSIECPKSKVQFYIAGEILVLSPDRQKQAPSTSFMQEQPATDLCSFLSIDDDFWPDKRLYHEAERDHFESLALNTKRNLPRESKRDSDDRHRDHDDDNSGGGGSSGRSRDSCGNSRSLLGTPQTERMIADLPGGMCSWSDYSTYLSSESERTVDRSLPLSTENPTFDSGLDYSLSSDVRSSSSELLSSSPPARNPQTESRVESLVDAEVTPREYPTAASSDGFQSPDHPGTCTNSSTFAHLRPRSKLHLGNEMREGSVQRCSPNGEVERETAKGEAERIRRIQVRSPLRPVLGLVLVEFEPSPLPYVYIYMHMYTYFSYLPLIVCH